MTNPLKEGEVEQIRRMSVRDFWVIRHDTDRLTLEESLIWDGRYYCSDVTD